jgi:hypothetical protein
MTRMENVTWLNVREAAKHVASLTGRKTHPQTIRDWANRGLRGVRLRSVYRGGVKLTCPEWLEEFFEAYTVARLGTPATLPPTDREVSRRQARALAEGRRLGIVEG